jgi:SAM-dependent methyltransferase
VSSVFGSDYSDAYDLLYSDKDYDAECNLIETLFRRYSSIPVSSVLDLGCGTGRHVFGMADRGYEVAGVDRSESMLAVAKQSLEISQSREKVRLHSGDIRTVDLGRHYDAVMIMFAVLGYQLENSDVMSVLKTARRHLKPGSLLIFDVWYGPAVLRERPSDRIKVIPTSNGKILRVASGELDVSRQCCSVRFHLWRVADGRVVSEIQETHRMRYFFPLELSFFLDSSGFSLERLGAFPKFDDEPDETTWNVVAVARAV